MNKETEEHTILMYTHWFANTSDSCHGDRILRIYGYHS